MPRETSRDRTWLLATSSSLFAEERMSLLQIKLRQNRAGYGSRRIMNYAAFRRARIGPTRASIADQSCSLVIAETRKCPVRSPSREHRRAEETYGLFYASAWQRERDGPVK
jgi:hypothetical protein